MTREGKNVSVTNSAPMENQSRIFKNRVLKGLWKILNIYVSGENNIPRLLPPGFNSYCPFVDSRPAWFHHTPKPLPTSSYCGEKPRHPVTLPVNISG